MAALILFAAYLLVWAPLYALSLVEMGSAERTIFNLAAGFTAVLGPILVYAVIDTRLTSSARVWVRVSARRLLQAMRGWFRRESAAMWANLGNDIRNFYSLQTGQHLVLPLLAAGVMANTDDLGLGNDLDTGIVDFVQREEVTGNLGESLFTAVDNFGNFGILLYLLAARALGFTEHFNQIWRAAIIAEPVLFFGQRALGGNRPADGWGCDWDFFHSTHGISGHASISAIPFLLLAHRAQGWKRGLLYALSLLPAISRTCRYQHYPSQVMLGWCLSYNATRAVLRTEDEKTASLLDPGFSPT